MTPHKLQHELGIQVSSQNNKAIEIPLGIQKIVSISHQPQNTFMSLLDPKKYKIMESRRKID